MGEYLLMPKLDMSMKEGTIVTWLVNTGDELKKGEYAVEVETGKVSIEVDNTAVSGKVLRIYFEEGDTVEVNTPILYIGSSDETPPPKEEAMEYFRQLKKQDSAVTEPHGYDYDAIIIGAGQAGYTFSMHASEYTSRIAVAEMRVFGGVCLNRGCIPSRFFYRRAEEILNLSDCKEFDIFSDGAKFDFASGVKKKDELVKKLRHSMKHTLSGICDVYEADARIIAPHMVKIGDDMVSAKYIVIASGSHPENPQIVSDKSVKVMTTEEVMCLDSLPGKAVLCGDSEYVIEQAMMLSAFGVDVTLMSGFCITGEDYLDRRIKKSVQKRKIPILSGSPSKIEGGCVITDKDEHIPCDVFIYENTRKANCVPSEVEFEFTKDGFYLTDESFSTSVEDIFAIGDSNGFSLTAQGAGSDGEELARILFAGKEPERRVYPKCINVYPKVSYVGYFENDLEKLGTAYISAKRSFASHPAAMASSSSAGGGYVKIICDEVYGEILGCQVVAENADEIIGIISLSMKNELTVDELAKSVFVHPTLSEIITTVCSELKEKIKLFREG